MEHVPAAALGAGPRRPARLLRLAGDERLVALVRRGDEGAFEALFDRHHRPILGFCRHMLGSREEAEDVVQHTFLAAYRDLLGSDKSIELRPWLFAIARNRCVSVLRTRREHASLELAQPSTAGLSETVEQREDLRELLGDLAGLPEDQRAALLLAELGALDHAGIAAVLGCQREKVKALVFQARSSLVASREARATSCEQIRTELATASGGALRRGPLRRHLRACAGCRAFKAEVGVQRKLLALALPVVPGLTLKASILSALGAGAADGGASSVAAGTGMAAVDAAGSIATTATGLRATAAGTSGAGLAAGAGGGAISGVLGTVVSTGAAKVAVSLTLAGAVAGGGALTLEARNDGSRPAPAASQRGPATAAPISPILPAGPIPSPAPGRSGTSGSALIDSAPPRSARSRGFLPQRGSGPGNGPAAREWARSHAPDVPRGADPSPGGKPGATRGASPGSTASPGRGTHPALTPPQGSPGGGDTSPAAGKRPANAGSPTAPSGRSRAGDPDGMPAAGATPPAAAPIPPAASTTPSVAPVPPRPAPTAPTG